MAARRCKSSGGIWRQKSPSSGGNRLQTGTLGARRTPPPPARPAGEGQRPCVGAVPSLRRQRARSAVPSLRRRSAVPSPRRQRVLGAVAQCPEVSSGAFNALEDCPASAHQEWSTHGSHKLHSGDGISFESQREKKRREQTFCRPRRSRNARSAPSAARRPFRASGGRLREDVRTLPEIAADSAATARSAALRASKNHRAMSECMRALDMGTRESEPVTWQIAHEALSRLARERAAADAEEARWLLAAQRAAVHVHLASVPSPNTCVMKHGRDR